MEQNKPGQGTEQNRKLNKTGNWTKQGTEQQDSDYIILRGYFPLIRFICSSSAFSFIPGCICVRVICLSFTLWLIRNQ